MPEFSTLAAVDLGLGVFGSGITCSSGSNSSDFITAVDFCMGTGNGRLASAERVQARADRGRGFGNRNA